LGDFPGDLDAYGIRIFGFNSYFHQETSVEKNDEMFP
jgi:hypothetical protein